MTKAQVKPFIGLTVAVMWRDPAGESGWSMSPLELTTASAETLGRILGYNDRGELIIAASRTADGGYGDRTAIPLACVDSITLLAPLGEPQVS